MAKTNFGFKEVEVELKEPLVQQIFSTVAPKYDMMNDLMSMGLHRLWKDALIAELNPKNNDILLDVAGGTGDIAYKFLKAGGKEVVLCDLNPEMLQYGKAKILQKYPHLYPQINWVQGNAESLPFEDNIFDYYSIAFGIRNVTNIKAALAEAYRVLKPGGKFVCLELCDINSKLLKRIYDFYSFKIIPKIGKRITGSAESYQYLVESIRKFPSPPRFQLMIEETGFNKVKYRKFTFGVIALHIAYK